MRVSRILPFPLPFSLAAAVIAAPVAAAAEESVPTVVVDIAPLHGLVSSIMGDLGAPHLLVPDGASPHDFALRPSDARSLGEADLVVWVGPALLPGLVKPMETLASHAKSVEMEDLEDAVHLPYRDLDKGGDDHDGEDHDHHHGDDDAEHDHADEHGHHHHTGDLDPHMWLAPDNGLALIGAVETALSDLDPAHAATYAANAESTRARIGALKSWMKETLVPLKNAHFMVFHDAFQYVETLGGPKALGALTLSPEVNPGAKHLAEIQDRLTAENVACVFAEPQFPTALVERLIQGTSARAAILDPLGASIPPGPGHYEATLRSVTEALASCLKGS